MPFPHPKTLPLWELKWNTAQLRKAYNESPREFRRGFQLDAMSDEERKLPFYEQAYKAGFGLNVERLLTSHPDMVCFMGVDPGGKSRPGSAISTLGLSGRSRIPLSIKFGQWTPRQVAEAVVAEYLRIGTFFNRLPAVIYVENNGLQDSYQDLISLLPDAPALPLRGFLTGKNKSDPDIGIEGIDAEFAQGLWIIPSDEWKDHEIGCSCDWCRWHSEFLNYPNYATNDGVMATWFAWNALRKGETGAKGEAVAVGGLEFNPSGDDTVDLGDGGMTNWDY